MMMIKTACQPCVSRPGGGGGWELGEQGEQNNPQTINSRLVQAHSHWHEYESGYPCVCYSKQEFASVMKIRWFASQNATHFRVFANQFNNLAHSGANHLVGYAGTSAWDL